MGSRSLDDMNRVEELLSLYILSLHFDYKNFILVTDGLRYQNISQEGQIMR
jgi:hypothetical protein